MSTHNIGFYEDLTKIIFELSSNIIKYAPYFFCCNFNPFESQRKKTCLWDFQPGPTQTGLFNHIRWLDA